MYPTQLLWSVIILSVLFYPIWMTFKPLEQILQITYTPKNKISQEQILILLKIKRRTQILTGYNSLATNCIVVFPSIQ